MAYTRLLLDIGFYRGVGIPRGRRSRVYVECGCCGHFHRADFGGDCREDGERFAEPPHDARQVVELRDGD